MSTIKASNIQNASSATVNLALDTSGNITGGGTIADSTAIIRPLVQTTSVASTSGTAIDFTGIPSWVERIMVMLQSVSTSGSSQLQIQLGTSSGVVATGYVCTATSTILGAIGTSAFTSGFVECPTGTATTTASTRSGHYIITNLTSNTWACSGLLCDTGTTAQKFSAGSIGLGGVLDRIRLTTINGTDTFDAGTVNVLYE